MTVREGLARPAKRLEVTAISSLSFRLTDEPIPATVHGQVTVTRAHAIVTDLPVRRASVVPSVRLLAEQAAEGLRHGLPEASG
jgi:hypothetical protein